MANLIHQNQGTVITWADSGATYAITLKGLASGTGRQGAEHDFGVGAVASRFIWLAQVQFDTATPPVVGEAVDIYLKPVQHELITREYFLEFGADCRLLKIYILPTRVQAQHLNLSRA